MSRLWLHRTGYRSLETYFCFLDFKVYFGWFRGTLGILCGIKVLFLGWGFIMWLGVGFLACGCVLWWVLGQNGPILGV